MSDIENLRQVVKSGIMIPLPTPSLFLGFILHKGDRRAEKYPHNITSFQPLDLMQRLLIHFMMG
jgi:hypothetical protein